MNTLIKWPGGKSGEINKIEGLFPKHERYIEPFFGGGAVFFHLQPQNAIINDISQSLMEYYELVKNQDKHLYNLLICYSNSFENVMNVCTKNYNDINFIYNNLKDGKINKKELWATIAQLTSAFASDINYGFSEKLILDEVEFINHLNKMVTDKMIRTVQNNEKAPFNDENLKNNLITGFASGYYMYFRKIFNDINLNKLSPPSLSYKIANFYFIREYCYGSMFRYNKKGEFNIPYGGMSYNKKNFKNKVENMFNKDVELIFKNTDIHNADFSEFFKSVDLTEKDFMFLDPPYDSNFSEYEGKDFTTDDQERLVHELKKTPAQFILVIKNTDFISELYKDDFNILSFDNKYTYNVRSRNERKVEHLIITNIPVK
ncbi:DNA adenine methylase [Candidatus Epulonipiscium fishelsonii]|nr:DNA adenine methylase [Epulopiscium sp. SCG-C06WGA-EpuloA1]